VRRVKREFTRHTRFGPCACRAHSAMTPTTVPTVSRTFVGLRCIDRSGNLHPLAKKIMTALIGYRLHSRYNLSSNGLTGGIGLREHSS
jgi:hypothetical protein